LQNTIIYISNNTISNLITKQIPEIADGVNLKDLSSEAKKRDCKICHSVTQATEENLADCANLM
jgi:hypothetical protein